MIKHYSINLLLIFLLLYVYISVSHELSEKARKPLIESLQVVMPAYIQAAMAMGDRYLAANIAITRAMAFRGLQAKPEDYMVQGKIQQQAAILNPRQEDNGYLAAAILSWEGQTQTANDILQTVGDARHWDPMPYFFKAFNLFYLEQENIKAAEFLRLAAERSGKQNKSALKSMSAKWLAGDDNPVYAINILKALYEAEQDENLKNKFAARIKQTQGLIDLRSAAEKFKQDALLPLTSLEQLVKAGYINSIPKDPIGLGYTVDENGIPTMISKIKRK